MENLGFNLGYVAVIAKEMEIQIYIYCFDIVFKLDISVILFWESNFCQKAFSVVIYSEFECLLMIDIN